MDVAVDFSHCFDQPINFGIQFINFCVHSSIAIFHLRPNRLETTRQRISANTMRLYTFVFEYEPTTP
jgi:hypothetical protein